MITRDTVVVGQRSPDLTLAHFTAILAAANSPAIMEALACYNAVLQQGISPAFALSIFKHESGFGLNGFGAVNKNPGNTRSSMTGIGIMVQTVKGPFIRYPSWREGFRDLAWRLVKPDFVYAQEGRKTIGQIIARWCPPGDMNNDTEGYINAVVTSMNQWVGSGEGNGSNNSTMTTTIQIDDRSGQLAAGKSSNRGSYHIDELILHETSGPNDRKDAPASLARTLDEATISWFLTPRSEVSIHYLIGGENLGAPIYRLCPESQAAYHCIGIKGSVDNFSIDNHESIGIERMGQPNDNPGPNQTRAMCELALDICRRNPRITPDRIFSHASLQPDRRDGNTLLAAVKKYVSDNLGANKVTTENQQPTVPTPEPDVITIQQTGKQLGFGFKSFWEGLNRLGDNYNLVLMGYPISNEFDINFTSDPTKKRTVQLFERSGLVYEAENAAPWDNHFMTLGQLMESYQYALDNHLLTPGAALTPFSGVEIKMSDLAKWGEVLQSTFESYALAGLDEGKIKTFDGLLVAMRSGQSYDDYLAAHK